MKISVHRLQCQPVNIQGVGVWVGIVILPVYVRTIVREVNVKKCENRSVRALGSEQRLSFTCTILCTLLSGSDLLTLSFLPEGEGVDLRPTAPSFP